MECTPLSRRGTPSVVKEEPEFASRGSRRRKFWPLVMALLLVCVIAVVVIFTVAGPRTGNVCLQKECVETAGMMLMNMDTSVDPCSDFYSFVCGKYADNNPISEDKSEVNPAILTSDLLTSQLIKLMNEPAEANEYEHFRKLKMYYELCMDTESMDKNGLSQLKEMISDLGGWPMIYDENSDATWQSVVYKIIEFGITPNYLLHLYVDSDFLNSTMRVLSLSSPHTYMGRPYMIKGRDDKDVKAYRKLMVDVAKVLGATEELIDAEVTDVLDFEIALINHTKSVEDKRQDFMALYNVYTVEKLHQDFPDFPWHTYLNNLTPKNVTVDYSTKVIVNEPAYVDFLIRSLRATPTRTIRNYLLWKTVLDMLSFVNTELRTLEEKFRARRFGRTSQIPRSVDCIRKINSMLLLLQSSLYIRRNFDPYSKTIASELVEYIKDQFRAILNHTDWASEDRKNAIEKLDALKSHVAYEDELLDDKKIGEFFSNLEIDKENYMKSTLSIARFQNEYEYMKLDKPINKSDWIDYSNSAVVNAYYKPEANSIIIPAGILQGPFFNAKRPRYVNFATIGFVIGHELSHGFDDIGHQLDKDGNAKNWWSDVAERDFEEKKLCVVEQYNGFKIFDDLMVNGNLTVGENLADFGGQKAAYLSYQSWVSKHGKELGLPGMNYTNEQLYWIASASLWCNNEKPESTKFRVMMDTHSPSNFRVNGPLSNLDIFAKDFACPLGSRMNPEKKCTPW